MRLEPARKSSQTHSGTVHWVKSTSLDLSCAICKFASDFFSGANSYSRKTV